MTHPVSRRRFIQGATALGTAAALGACTSDDSRSTPATRPLGTDAPHPSADGTLVLVTLYGGNDALNMVAPVADPRYASLRGALALDPATAHDLGEGFALHSAMPRSKALWDDGHLAVVHGVGFDGLDRSHFHCMDVWQTGAADAVSTGWIGRWLDAVGNDPLDAIAVAYRPPLVTRGHRRSAAVVPPGPFELPGDDDLHALLAGLAAQDRKRPALGALAAANTIDLLAVASTVGPLVASSPAADTLAARLETVATLINAGLPTRAYAVDLGGFDTHAGQAPTHAALLGELDSALGDFLERVAGHKVTVLVYSEFGRRVEPNASAGTDHGGAGTVLLAGAVRPGHHGDAPPLTALADGDLATTVDFRSVYGAILEGVLGVDAKDVLDSPPRPLDLV